MTIADKFNYLNNTKKAIKNALINKGVEVSDSDSFRSYADKVASIKTGEGSGAEITEVRCDPANFPVQAEKKVILAYTGEQPAAEKNLLAPFDYKTTWTKSNITPLQNSEYDFIMQSSSYSLAYKKEDEKYALTYLTPKSISVNAKLALGKYNMFLSQATYTNGYCLTKRFNRQAEIEDIIFDIEPEVPTGNYNNTYLSKVILPTYDDKYIWVFYRYYQNSTVATSQPKVYIYKLRYVEDEDKLYADKITEYTQSIETTYPIYHAKQSADDYTFLFEYKGRREWLQFNDETNTIEFKAAEVFSGTQLEVSFLKKDWFINSGAVVYTYELLTDGTCSQTHTMSLSGQYYMEPFEGVLWNRSNGWLIYNTIPSNGNNKEVQVTGVPYRDRIILEYDTTFDEILFKKILDDGTIEDISVPDPYGSIDSIDDDGRIRGRLKGSTTTTVTQPVDGNYTNGIQESSKISFSGSSLVSMNSGHVTGIKNGKSLIYGYSSPKILKGFNSEVSIANSYLYYAFEDAVVFTGGSTATPGVTDTKIVKITDDYELIEYSNSGTLFKRYAFKINETYFFITTNGSIYKAIFNEDDLTYTSELLYKDSSLSFSSSFYPNDVINTKDGKYIIIPDAKKYFEISGTESEPNVQLKDFPEILKISLNTNIRFVQAFYDKSFGIQLSNGTYLMCRYDEGIDIDLSIEEYAPRLYDKRGSTIMYYTQNKNYWMSYIYSTQTPTLTAYAVGKGLTIPSHYKMTAFPNTSTYYNSGILTGFMTGEVVKEDETGSKIIKVRTALPEEEGAAPINYSDVVNCYVSGVALGQPELNSTGTELEPSSVCDVEVLLTKVGYQASGSDTLSPDVRINFITENGCAYNPDKTFNRYLVVDGVVDPNSSIYISQWNFDKNYMPIFMNNGLVTVGVNVTTKASSAYNARTCQLAYDRAGSGSNYYYEYAHYIHTDFGIMRGYRNSLMRLEDDLTFKTIALRDYYSEFGEYTKVHISGDREEFYCSYPDGLNPTEEFLISKFTLNSDNDTYTAVKIAQCPNVNEAFRDWDSLRNEVFIQCKGRVLTETGYLLHAVYEYGFSCFDINTQDESLSTFGFFPFPENILTTLGNRTVHKIQAFYDNTFSLDLNEGTTLICKFTGKESIDILEVVEPFIVEGDSTVYHRTFSENKLYWYQNDATLAPISSNPYGPYNATKSTVDWLAVPREQNRWNSTVLTGVIRQSAQLAKPVFDDTGRRVLQVETTIKKNNCNDNATYEWTLEDYNRVNG